MHPSARYYAEKFFFTYTKIPDYAKILEIGSLNVNGTLKDLCPKNANYIGVDFISGKGVDIVIDDPYKLPFENDEFDVVLCSSVLEHSDFFWLLIIEMMRVLRPGGLLYINAPSNGYIHRYPVDSWRFYPDAGKSIVSWCKKNNIEANLLESFLGSKLYENINYDAWVDFVCIISKGQPENFDGQRILNTINEYSNAFCNKNGIDLNLNYESLSVDYLEINHLHKYIEICEEEIRSLKIKLENINTKLPSNKL